MADFYYCFGIYLDDNFCEKTCNKRSNCKYFDEDFYKKYGDMLDRFDFLICSENCKYYAPRREEDQKNMSGEDVIPF